MLAVLTLTDLQEQCSPATVNLVTGSCGLPPRDGFDAMQQAPADARRAHEHASCFGPLLRLGSDARRLATSPAGFSWVGAQPLELLHRIGIGAVYEHDVALANRFRAGLAPSDSAIVCVEPAAPADPSALA